MKKLFCPLLLLFALVSYAQDCGPNLTLEESKEIGLVAYLSHVKSLSETMAIIKGEAAIGCYYTIKESSDVLINQLCADMTDKRGLKLYRDFNNEIRNNKIESDRTNNYRNLIDNIDTAFVSLKRIQKDVTQESSLIDALGTLGIEPYSIYKDIVAAKTKKVEGLVAQLKELKLQPLESKKKE